MPRALGLLWRTAHIAVRTEDAAVTRLGTQYGVTLETLVGVDARVHRHRLSASGSAMRASDRRHQEGRVHSAVLRRGNHDGSQNAHLCSSFINGWRRSTRAMMGTPTRNGINQYVA